MQIPLMKTPQSKVIMLWKTGDGNTADEDRGLPCTLMNIFKWKEAGWLQRRLGTERFRYKSS